MKALLFAFTLLSFNVLAADSCLSCISKAAFPDASKQASKQVDNLNSGMSQMSASEVYEIILTQKLTFGIPACDNQKCVSNLTDAQLSIATNLKKAPTSNFKELVLKENLAEINSLQYTHTQKYDFSFIDKSGAKYLTTMRRRGIIPNVFFLLTATLDFEKNAPFTRLLREGSLKKAQASMPTAAIDIDAKRPPVCFGVYNEHIECFIEFRGSATMNNL